MARPARARSSLALAVAARTLPPVGRRGRRPIAQVGPNTFRPPHPPANGVHPEARHGIVRVLDEAAGNEIGQPLLDVGRRQREVFGQRGRIGRAAPEEPLDDRDLFRAQRQQFERREALAHIARCARVDLGLHPIEDAGHIDLLEPRHASSGIGIGSGCGRQSSHHSTSATTIACGTPSLLG